MQGILLVALSYWVTALWMDRYFPKLIFIAGVFAVVGIIAVVEAIFKKTDVTLDVEGAILSPEGAGRFYDELNAICRKARHGSSRSGHRRHRRQFLRDRGPGARRRQDARRQNAVRQSLAA